MWYLYLDESGDLGFDFVNKKPSKYFTICILAIKGIDKNRALIGCVRKTLARKLNKRKGKKRIVRELKGAGTTIEVKKYFYEKIKSLPFAIFALSLNKRKLYERLMREKDRVYNYIARLVLDQIKFENAFVQIELIVDKCKSQKQIKEFNEYIFSQLKARINPKVPMNIKHENSIYFEGLQAADLFSWGIFRAHEREDLKWYEVFKEKIKFNETYL